MKDEIRIAIEDGVRAIQGMLEETSLEFIEKAAQMIADCYKRDGRLYIAGNGGSLCDAMHFAEELTGYFREKRRALPAVAFSDPGHLTCVGNDAGFETVFERHLEALAREGDVFVLLSTSGNSENIVRAAKKAKAMGVETIAFLGKGGGQLGGICDLEWIVSGAATSDRIQEAHMTAIHIVIEMVEKELFAEVVVG